MRVLHLDTEGGYGGSSRSLQITVNKLVLEGGMSEVWHAKDGPSNKILHEKGINTKINRNIVSIVPLPNNNLKNKEEDILSGKLEKASEPYGLSKIHGIKAKKTNKDKPQ